MKDLNLTSYDWSKFYFWDESKYTRNLVIEHENFEIMILCWNKGINSAIHDHPSDGCWIVGIEGSILEQKYTKSNEGKMIKNSEDIIRKGDISWMHDSIGFHRVGNASKEEGAVTLHIYSPPIKKCNAYDEDGNAISRKSFYYSIKGEKVIN